MYCCGKGIRIKKKRTEDLLKLKELISEDENKFREELKDTV